MTDSERILVLETANRQLRWLVTHLQSCLHQKNLALDAMHWVWRDGGCPGGVHRYDDMREAPLTEEIVAAAERNTERLRRWLRNAEGREARLQVAGVLNNSFSDPEAQS